MHRKLLNMAKLTGLYPLAVLSDRVVYPSPGPSPLDFLPKPEGVQEMLWAVDLMEKGYDPARHVEGGDAALDEGE